MTTQGTARLARLLSMVPWLATREGVTISEAAEHFGVSAEEFEKDLWLVVCCGLPGHGPDQLIDIQFWDDEGHIDVIDPQTLSAPTRLTTEEAASLQVGLAILSSIASEEDRAFITATMATLSELSQGDPRSDRQANESGVEPTEQGESLLLPLRAGHDIDPSIADAIRLAVEARTPVHISYYGSTTDSVTQRQIWPHRVVVTGSMAYVHAWCASAQAERTFRMDRIQTASPMVSAPPHPEQFAVGFDADPPAEHPVEVQVGIHRSARWLLDAYDFVVTGPDDQSVSPSADAEWITATIHVWDPRWIIRLALSMNAGLEVREPRRLRSAVHRAARDALTAPRGFSAL